MSSSSKACLLAACLIAALPFLPVSQTPTPPPAREPVVQVVYAGRLIDAVTDQVRQGVSVVVEGGRIRELRDGKVVRPGEVLVDLGDSTVMPGLIDCHTHLTFEVSKGKTLKDLLLARDSALAIAATAYARRTLLAGFTTVKIVEALGFAT